MYTNRAYYHNHLSLIVRFLEFLCCPKYFPPNLQLLQEFWTIETEKITAQCNIPMFNTGGIQLVYTQISRNAEKEGIFFFI